MDLVGGCLLAAVCLHAYRCSWTPTPRARNRAVGFRYAAAAGLLALTAGSTRPWGMLLLWPAAGLGWVAAGYLGLGASIYRKEAGRLPWSTRVLMAPVLLGHWLSYRSLPAAVPALGRGGPRGARGAAPLEPGGPWSHRGGGLGRPGPHGGKLGSRAVPGSSLPEPAGAGPHRSFPGTAPDRSGLPPGSMRREARSTSTARSAIPEARPWRRRTSWPTNWAGTRKTPSNGYSGSGPAWSSGPKSAPACGNSRSRADQEARGIRDRGLEAVAAPAADDHLARGGNGEAPGRCGPHGPSRRSPGSPRGCRRCSGPSCPPGRRRWRTCRPSRCRRWGWCSSSRAARRWAVFIA